MRFFSKISNNIFKTFDDKDNYFNDFSVIVAIIADLWYNIFETPGAFKVRKDSENSDTREKEAVGTDATLLKALSQITPEEKSILDGNGEIDRTLYMRDNSAQIDCKLLLDSGKLITLRPHTRFVHFPAHTHNYVEMIYMCRGSTHHIINGTDVVLETGELLLLGQSAVQEIYPADENDVAVNFIILPRFFDTAINLMGEGENPIRDFLIGCLCGRDNGVHYLHFKISDVLPIQNLLENLIWTLANHQPNKRSINQITMGLLFLQLANHTETLRIESVLSEKKLMLHVLRYVEEHYTDGSLRELAAKLHYDESWLSRAVKLYSGRNFTELLQERRLNQAAYLLKTTGLKVSDVGERVGYENLSYFHKIFKARYGLSPFKYRKNK